MKQLNRKKWEKMLKDTKIKFAMEYDSKTNHIDMGVLFNGEMGKPEELSDEQLVLFFLLLNTVCNMLVDEQVKRDLIPDPDTYMPTKPMGDVS